MDAIAHAPLNSQDPPHLLQTHLLEVARLASGFSPEWMAHWTGLAGRWHDLGKYSADFQKYIRGKSGYEAHLVDTVPNKVNHSTAGALYAIQQFGVLGRPLAYLIAGHHAGLPDWSAEEGGAAALASRLKDGGEGEKSLLAQALAEAIPPAILAGDKPALEGARFGGSAGLHLWIRLLFSCLVDADFLDTEKYMQPDKAAQRLAPVPLAELRDRLNAYMAAKSANADPSPVNTLRADVLQQCRDKAQGSSGIYTLTVPTGGGKTLSSLAFALTHAMQHGKQRVIYAIPYTSIIEQTADVFRQALGAEAVLEHHSNFDPSPERETRNSRLAAENWDASLIVTTNVQLFESLFAARTSRCRKLHRLVNSVIILDEAQLLPPEFLQPILATMRLLVTHYGVTFVLCTATQPALGSRKDSFGRSLLQGLDESTEIIADVPALYAALERVDVTLPAHFNEAEDWASLAADIEQHPCVLAIVNTRQDCLSLYQHLPKDTIHLSALMCGEHRSGVIADIKAKLKAGQPVRVVSTQLIEAGVDVDFPVVYRALAGLDSIAQAAGRCNREGKAHRGRVVVFVPPTPAPKGWLRFGEDACKAVLYDHPEQPLQPERFSDYFKHYYAAAGEDGLDKQGIVSLLTQDAGSCQIQFRTVAERFHLIDQKGSTAVIVPYANPAEPARDSRSIVARIRAGEAHRDILRQLQRFTVTLYHYQFLALHKAGELEEIIPDLWVVRNDTTYHDRLGLLITGDTQIAPTALCL